MPQAPSLLPPCFPLSLPGVPLPLVAAPHFTLTHLWGAAHCCSPLLLSSSPSFLLPWFQELLALTEQSAVLVA